MASPVKPGDRIRVLSWGNFAKYRGLLGTVRHVSLQGVVVVDLDDDPMKGRKQIHRLGLVFDPAFKADRYVKCDE